MISLIRYGLCFYMRGGPRKASCTLGNKEQSGTDMDGSCSLCAYEAKRTSTNPGGEKMLNMVHCLKESFVHDWWVINSVPTMVKLRKLYVGTAWLV